jgi:transposase
MEAKRKRLAGDTAREANNGEVSGRRYEALDLKEIVAEQVLVFFLFKKLGLGMRSFIRAQKILDSVIRVCR